MASTVNIYLDAPDLATATAVFTDSALTVKASDGWYSNGVISRKQVSGELQVAETCVTCSVPCSGAINATGNVGAYVLPVNVGDTASDVGAVIIYFDPVNIPDGIKVVYDSVTYNEGVILDNNEGYVTATGTNPLFTGRSSSAGSCPSGFTGGGTTTVDQSTYNASSSSFVQDSGVTQTVTWTSSDVHLTTDAPEEVMMVIPKPNASPGNLEVTIYGVCGSTGWGIELNCPAVLPSFQSSEDASASITAACGEPIDTSYYVANHKGHTSGTINLMDRIYVDEDAVQNLGAAKGAGYFKYDTNKYYQIDVNGVVISKGDCPTVSSFTGSANTNFNSICAGGTPPTAGTTYYHNGSGAYPTTGDVVYTDSGATTFAPAGYIYLYNSGGNNYYIQIGSNGVVSSDSNCSAPSNTFFRSGVQSSCGNFCTGNYNISVPAATDTNHSFLNVVEGDEIVGGSLTDGWYAYAATSTDTSTGTFLIMQLQSNEVVVRAECDGTSCLLI